MDSLSERPVTLRDRHKSATRDAIMNAAATLLTTQSSHVRMEDIAARAGIGVGTLFGNYLAAALRNPSAAQGQFGNLIFGFAVTEALGIFSLLIALLLLFAL